MKIRKLTATFGKLRQQTLELEDGLNIIEAPNEGGKSTWAGFLRAMLYGIDTKERDRKGILAEKNRVQPWDGSPVEGSMDLNWAGREITLRRTSRTNAPMGQFQAVYTGTEEPVPGLTGDNVGEALTGVGREAFERSAFIGQSAVAVGGSAELEQRISRIVSSGQEDVSYSETEERLRKWRNRRQSNRKTGLIPQLEEEKAQVAATLERLEGANRQASAARAQIRALEEERAALEREAAAHRALAGAKIKEQIAQAEEELAQAEAALEAVRRERGRHGTPPEGEKLREMQGELSYLNTLDANIKQAQRESAQAGEAPVYIDHPVFAGMEPPAVRERAEADFKRVQQENEDRKEGAKGTLPVNTRLAVIGILLLTGVLVLLIHFFAGDNMVMNGIVLALCAVAVIIVAVRGVVKRWKDAMAVSHLLELYGVRESQEIIDNAKEYIARWEAADQARREAAARVVTMERLTAEREELTERLLEVTHGFAPDVTDLFGVSAAVSRALNLEEKEHSAALRVDSARRVLRAVSAQGTPEAEEVPDQIPVRDAREVAARLSAVGDELSRLNGMLAMAQGEMNTLGDPAALQARLGELEGELGRRQEEYDALTIAMEGLDEANAQLQQRMSPALNARAGELLSRLTGGKYDKVSLTREFEALAGSQGDASPKKSLALSRGTADQIYLAVRLAVCGLVLDQEDKAPLVLDDALVNFDDERLGLALDLLRELAGERQILLFTCQSREGRYLAGAKGVNLIRLQS